MEFTIEQNKTMMAHLMLSSESVSTEVARTTDWIDNEELVATLQINGVEVPATVMEEFMKGLWVRAKDDAKYKYDGEKFEQRVEDRANQLLKDHADNALEQLQDLTEKLESIGDVLTPSWERK